MLGYGFQCPSTKLCARRWFECFDKCDDDDDCLQCYVYQQATDCLEMYGFMCLDGKCAKGYWCDKRFDCSHGEDEMFCSLLRIESKKNFL